MNILLHGNMYTSPIPHFFTLRLFYFSGNAIKKTLILALGMDELDIGETLRSQQMVQRNAR
jgi:hypothetical protein